MNTIITVEEKPWISVENSKPKVNIEMLLCLSNGEMSTGYLAKRKPKSVWFVDKTQDDEGVRVTHWRELPKKPKPSNDL